MKPFIIPFFLTHQGCPHRCVYCDQRIAGGHREDALSPEAVRRGIEAGLASRRLKPGSLVEAAFFGGTFTMLPRSRQAALLEAAAPYLAEGRVSGIRLSTRPDALAEDQVEFLAERGVRTVEIGAQSMDDKVLAASERGHTSEDVALSAGRVKEAGLRLGLQLLPGLPGEDGASRKNTLKRVLSLEPDDARIYPLLVLKGTPLAELHAKGLYRPFTLSEAVDVCADMFARLTLSGVRVIRMGLQAGPELTAGLAAGPYHPAFGHLVKAETYRRALASVLTMFPSSEAAPALQTAPEDISLALGHRRRNVLELAAEHGLAELTVESDAELSRGNFRWQGCEFSIYGLAASAAGSRNMLE